MTGVCSSCGREMQVPSHRGSKLADYRCRYCGGELHGKTKGRKGPSGRLVKCAICGRRRRSDGGWVVFPGQRFRLDPNGFEGKVYASWAERRGKNLLGNPQTEPYQAGPHEAGAAACDSHQLELLG